MIRNFSRTRACTPVLFHDVHREVDRLVDSLWDRGERSVLGFLPRTDLAETEKAYEVTIDLPGVDPDDLVIEVKEGDLSFAGERKNETEETDKTFLSVERSYGSFRRMVRLDGDVDTEKIEAAYKDGVLTITVPKAAAVQPKRIEVKT